MVHDILRQMEEYEMKFLLRSLRIICIILVEKCTRREMNDQPAVELIIDTSIDGAMNDEDDEGSSEEGGYNEIKLVLSNMMHLGTIVTVPVDFVMQTS
jgi:hypothetical protein